MTESMNRLVLLSIIVVLGLAFSVAAPMAGASDNYDYEIKLLDNSVDVPEKTVTVEGETFTVNSIGFVDPGNSFDATVETGRSDEFDLYLYDNERQIQDTRSLTAGEIVTFGSSQLDPGTHSLAVNVDTIETAKPVVVRAYDVSPPETQPEKSDIEPGDEVTVTTTLTDLDPVPISRVELVMWDGSESDRIPMSEIENGTFEATISEFGEGSYELYAVVYGEEEIEGENENEIIALGHSTSVSVSDQESTSGDGSQDDTGSGEQTRTSVTTSEVPDVTTTTTNGEEITTTVDNSQNVSSTTAPTKTPPTTTFETTTPVVSTTESDDGVITPVTTTGETRGEVPLYGIPLLVLSLLLIGIGAERL